SNLLLRYLWDTTLEAIAKPRFAQKCHSERSEESRIFNDLRSFTPLRMTVKTGFAIASGILGTQRQWCHDY
ncbi:MAG: hypothetical protein WCC75_12615, partial [Desulfobaccales bacterium]